MKKSMLIILSLVTSLALTGCVTTQPYESVVMVNVVEVPNKDKNALFKKTRQWFSEYFVSGKSVVDYSDMEEGTIIGKGKAYVQDQDFTGLVRIYVRYTIRIDIKDGKFKATTTILNFTAANNINEAGHPQGTPREEEAKSAEKVLNKLVNDIKTYVTDNKSNANSDW